MITVSDKLKTFAEGIIEKVAQDSKRKLDEFTSKCDELLVREKQNALKEAESIIDNAKKKAELKRMQIISKAKIDKEHALLVKRNEIYLKVIEDLKSMAAEFTSDPRYSDFLKDLALKAISRLGEEDILIYLKQSDLEKHKESILDYVNKMQKGIKAKIVETEEDIIGGLICSDKDNIRSVDCSLRNLIEENKETIGKLLMEKL